MTEEKPPKKKRRIFRRLTPDSLEGKAAFATAVVSLLTVLVVWIVRGIGLDYVSFSHTMTGWRMAAELGLAILVPIVLYWGLRRWNQVTEGLFPDIDHAWKAGIDALKSNGISTDELPIFLILGSAEAELEAALVHASLSSPTVQRVPSEVGIRHALQWYAGDDAIYLFCPGASSLSALVRQWDSQSSVRLAVPRPLAPRPPAAVSESGPPTGSTVASTHEEPADRPSPQPASETAGKAATTPQPAPAHMQTIDPSQVESEQPAVGESQAAGRATDQTITTVKPQPSSPAKTGVPSSLPDTSHPEGTIIVDQVTVDRQPAEAAPSDRVDQPDVSKREPSSTTTSAPSPHAAGGGEGVPRATDADPIVRPRLEVQPRASRRSVALPPALDTSDQLPRLQYVCHLLRRIRRPRCGINGIVTLMPFQLSQVGSQHLAAPAQSARGDLETIQQTLRLRCPTTAMLIGLEQDRGFHELLVRRLRTDLLSRRLGGRFDLRNRPTPDQLNDHSDRLCDAFEDWIYQLFRLDDALRQQRGNRTLYGLMSRIRHELKPRLRIVLGRVFGCDPPAPDDSSFFFSGCYFASIGATSSVPAFVKGVLHDKLVGEQAQVEWSRQALRVHRYFRWFAITGWLLLVILTSSLLFILVTSLRMSS